MDNNNTMEYRINLEKQNKSNDQVTELILDNCRASQISGLTDDFVNLETLSLINVGLLTLKGFPKLPKLKKLELSDNRIQIGLSSLHGCPKLQHLNLSGNRIKDIEALEPLRQLEDLVTLDLYNCEVTKAFLYRRTVFNLLPGLHSLDGYDKFEREVDDSDESDDEGSDVENRITRDDNDLDEEDEADDESSEYDEEEELNGMSYDEEEDDDEELENEDVDEEGESGGEDDSYDQTPEGVSSGDVANTNEATNGKLGLGQLKTFKNTGDGVEGGIDDDDDEDEDDDDDDEEDDEEEGSDLKQLQRDYGDEEDSDDDDFEPDQEPDERDHEIDPEDDAELEDPLSTSIKASVASAAAATTEIDTIDLFPIQRGQKRKHEDEGGDSVAS